jgi:hypothetical protein
MNKAKRFEIAKLEALRHYAQVNAGLSIGSSSIDKLELARTIV